MTASSFLHCLMHLISFIFQPSLEAVAALFGAICSLLRRCGAWRQQARWVHILGKAEIKHPVIGALQERLINKDQRHFLDSFLEKSLAAPFHLQQWDLRFGAWISFCVFSSMVAAVSPGGKRMSVSQDIRHSSSRGDRGLRKMMP